MFIKQHNKNQYGIAEGFYIRNFTAHYAIPKDINEIYSTQDYDLFLENEQKNIEQKYPLIDNEMIHHRDVIIISDGYNFSNLHKVLAKVPKSVAIIATNGALKYWELLQSFSNTPRSITYYVVNNPYEECSDFLPDRHRYYPKCIASIRTNPDFLHGYSGLKYFYCPPETKDYSGINLKSSYKIDDYRNPICASLGLAYKFGAKRILLFCCDEYFEDERPAAIQLENNLWCYPQQLKSNRIIDAYCHWFKKEKINIATTNNIKQDNLSYIKPQEEEILEFFNE